MGTPISWGTFPLGPLASYESKAKIYFWYYPINTPPLILRLTLDALLFSRQNKEYLSVLVEAYGVVPMLVIPLFISVISIRSSNGRGLQNRSLYR